MDSTADVAVNQKIKEGDIIRIRNSGIAEMDGLLCTVTEKYSSAKKGKSGFLRMFDTYKTNGSNVHVNNVDNERCVLGLHY